MRRNTVIAAAILVAGCARHDAAADNEIDLNAAAVAAQSEVDAYAAATAAKHEADASAASRPAAAPAMPPVEPIAPGQPGGLPDDRTPVSEAPFAADSAQGAADVVQTYFALIGERQYRRAYALWDDGGRASGTSGEAFVASFGRYAQYAAQVGAPGRIDAGAGQRHVEVPVQVYGRLTDGSPFHASGTATLHRTGDIDGATAAQKTWHISALDLTPRQPAGKTPSSH